MDKKVQWKPWNRAVIGEPEIIPPTPVCRRTAMIDGFDARGSMPLKGAASIAS